MAAAVASGSHPEGAASQARSSATRVHTYDSMAHAHDLNAPQSVPSQYRRTGKANAPADQDRQAKRPSRSLPGSAYAAKTGTSALESLSPAIRTNVDDAIERAASGKVRFPGHDGEVYNNSDGLLPRGGNYTEWTAAQPGAKRGADRVIVEGDPANPNAIYYWDHLNPPVRIGP